LKTIKIYEEKIIKKMNIVKKDERSANPKIEKLNSSDTECLKTSNDKLVDVLTKTKIEKNDLISKSSKKSDRNKTIRG
jgi:hypothetical protein